MFGKLLIIKLLFSPFILLAQYGDFQQKVDIKGKVQFINTKTDSVLFDKCLSIKPIIGISSQTDSSFHKFIVIVTKKNTVLFDFVNGKAIETIPKCDSISFYEIEDWLDSDAEFNYPKKVIYGITHSLRSQNVNDRSFLFNVETNKTAGLFPNFLTFHYHKAKKWIVVDLLHYSFVLSENFDSITQLTEEFRAIGDNFYMGRNPKSFEWGVFNGDGKLVIPFIYCQLSYLGDSLFGATNDLGKVGIIDMYGNTIIPFDYECLDFGSWRCSCDQQLEVLYKNVFRFRKDRNDVIVDQNNQVLISEKEYWSIKPMKKDKSKLYVQTRDNQYGMYDLSSRKLIIPCEYNDITVYSESVIATKNNRIGIITLHENKIISPFVYELEYSAFTSDSTHKYYFILEKEGRMGVLQADGTEILPFIYDKIELKNNFLLIKQRGLFGLYDPDIFKEILPISFSKIDVYNQKIELNEGTEVKRGSFNRNGSIKW